MILIAGLASDGPVNVPVRLPDLSTAFKLFGGRYVQRETITPTQTYQGMDFAPQGPVYNTLDARRSYLYSPTILVSGGIQFGPNGGSSDHTLDLDYTPYLGQSDLLTALSFVMTSTPFVPIYGLRLSGVYSSATSGSWLFEGVQAGTRYNNISIVATASGLTISGGEPNFPTCAYTTTDPSTLSQLIQVDVSLGKSPLILRSFGTTLGTFSITTSGGSDGQIDSTAIATLMDAVNIPVDVSQVYILTAASPSIITAFAAGLSENPQPRMFYMNATTVTSPASGWVDGLSSALPSRHSLLGLVAGEIEIEVAGDVRTRYAVEGLAQGMARSGNTNPTNLPCSALTTIPEFTGDQLTSLKAKGFMGIRNAIPFGLTVYEGVTSANDKSFLYCTKVAEIASVAYTFGYAQIGKAQQQGDRDDLSKSLAALLDKVPLVTTESCKIKIESYVMYIDITVRIPNEILSIRFSVKSS